MFHDSSLMFLSVCLLLCYIYLNSFWRAY